MPTPLTISLVVLHYEQPEELTTLFTALEALENVPDEIIIVDDASTQFPLKPENLEAYGLNTLLVCLPRNLGPVGAMNAGLTAATGDYIHILACDDAVTADFYAVARNHLTNIDETGIYSTNTRVSDATGRDLGVYGLPQPATAASFLTSRIVHERLYEKGSWFAGNATLFATKHLAAMGGFDAGLEEYADAFACYILANQWGAFFEPRPLALKRDPVSGRNMSIYRDARKSHAICTLAVQRMRTDFPNTFTDKFIKRFEQRWRFNERAIRLYDSNEKLSGTSSLSPLAKAWVAILYLVYRPREFMEKLTPRRARRYHSQD